MSMDPRPVRYSTVDWLSLIVGWLCVAGIVTLGWRAQSGWQSDADRADAMEAQVEAYQQAIVELQERTPSYDTLDLSEVSDYHLRLTRAAETAFELPAGVMGHLVTVESSWRPSAVSSVGAVGLAQVKPSTARTVDASLTHEDLLRPEVSVMVGAEYLRRLLVRYRGNLRRALRAYNAGPTRVDREGRDVGGGYADRVMAR